MASAALPSPPWTELPDDLTANILQRLHIEEILMSAQKVCTTWWRVCKNPAMWRVINLDFLDWMDEEFDKKCRCTVDRSQGQLVDLKVTNYDKDYGFLNYVANRSSQLRCLTLTGYDNMEENALTDAIKKLPKLEELHLISMPPLSLEQFESIGISCPMLKSFTYEGNGYENGKFCTEHVVAIGKTMPNLRHLRIWTKRMKNEGLEAILNGCPHLESLDLRRCYGLDLEGALGKRCCEQIRHLRLPSDYSDIDWLIKYSEYDDIDYEYEYDHIDCDCDQCL